MPPFRVKICGVRLAGDIEAVVASGADAIGLNFFPPSCRFVDPDVETTRALAEAAEKAGLVRVGVFVNERPERIRQVAESLRLDAVQLHGDESPADADRFLAWGIPVIRAIKLAPGPLAPESIDKAVGEWGRRPVRLLLDADAGVAHGGSGQRIDWEGVRQWSRRHPDVAWTLAGGLNPSNVSVAITSSGARSVDVASGVESGRGEKSAALIRSFSEAAANNFR